MKLINRLSISYPVTLSLVMVLVFILLSQLGAVALSSLFNSISAGDSVSSGNLAVYTRYASSALMMLLIWKLGGLKASGISLPPAHWHSQWPLITTPMLVVVCLNLSRVQWHDVAFSLSLIPGWLFTHLATGLFEEIMMRALVFFLLARAWSHKSNGQLKAAIAQAAIFGGLHMLNLLNGVSVEVIVQVIYATFLGISFAGIVALSRTIWPAVICHSLINATGSINRTFVPDYVEQQTSIIYYLVFTSIIFLATTVPAFFMLKRAEHRRLQPTNLQPDYA